MKNRVIEIDHHLPEKGLNLKEKNREMIFKDRGKEEDKQSNKG